MLITTAMIALLSLNCFAATDEQGRNWQNKDIHLQVANLPDEYSGTLKREYKINDSEWISLGDEIFSTINIPETATVYVRNVDNAGNVSQISDTFYIDKIKPQEPTIWRRIFLENTRDACARWTLFVSKRAR